MIDHECFRWCHLAYLFLAKKDAERILKYREHIDKVNYDGIQFPVKLKYKTKIEKMNDIRFNVFGATEENSDVYPVHFREDL